MTDRIAREAARIVVERGAAIDEAVRRAAEQLRSGKAPLPSAGLVRRHVQGMREATLGREGYAEEVRRVWARAEAVMSMIEDAFPLAQTLLVGRAAEGHIDGGVTLHVRAAIEEPLREVALLLIERGYEEPRFETADTRFGRFDRIRFDDDGVEIVITRCPAGWPQPVCDLFTGKPVAHASAETLRRRVADEV